MNLNIGILAMKSAVLQVNSGLNVVAPARLASLLLKRFILRANSFAVFTWLYIGCQIREFTPWSNLK